MCFAAIGVIAGIAGTLVSAMGQMQQAKAASQAATYNSEVSNIMANDAILRGQAEEDAKRRETASLAGRQRAVMAANGVDITMGSPLQVLGDTARMGELDAISVRTDAEREATALRNQSQLYQAEASSALSGGAIGAFGTVLSGVGTVADKWYKMRAPSYGGVAT
jgi:hypothetical protein